MPGRGTTRKEKKKRKKKMAFFILITSIRRDENILGLEKCFGILLELRVRLSSSRVATW